MDTEAGSAAGRTYRLATENGLVWRAWDGEIVVLNEASGDTHRLDLFASAAFEALLEAPADAPALARRLAAELGVDDDGQLGAALEGALAKFAELELLA
jgi:PqqD family protein of HPr-rel-A system